MTDPDRVFLRAFAVWLAILVGANLNGAFRELVLRPRVGPAAAHAVSTLLLCALILAIARLSIRWLAPAEARTAWRVGFLWLLLTLAFEFLAGRFLFGNSWERLLAEYDVTAGRLWILVPIVTLMAPRWAWSREMSASRAHRAGALVAILCAGASACGEAPAPGPVNGNARSETVAAEPVDWTVRLDGVGPVGYGMTIGEAAAAAQDPAGAPPPSEACRFVRLHGMPEGMTLLVERDRVLRADVTHGALATAAGARIGMSEREVQSLYGDALEVRPHKYDSAGRYLVLVPEGVDSLRLVFETDGRTVTRFRAGLLPAVEYVEGCG